MTRKRTIFVLVILLAVLLVPGAARAQDTVTVANMTIRVWPEFDDPSVLLILEGQASAPGPVDLTIPLPAGSRINAVAYTDDTGNLLTLENTEQGGGITFQTPTGGFWIEIYDPALAMDGDNRSYDLSWTPTFNITNLGIEVQTPFGARSMAIIPEGTTGGTDQFGLPLTVISQQNVQAGDTVSLSFTYTKTDPTLSADWLGQTLPSEVTPSAPIGAAAGGAPSTLVIVLMIVGGLALVGGGVWYVLQSRQKPGARAAHRVVPAARGAGQKFCTQCGKAIEPGDKFCRHCGAKV
jgi:hypothetical protein